MRLVFFGYSNIGYVCLEVLIDLCGQLQDEIVAVVTHEDDPREQIWFKSVRELALAHHLPVYTPASAKDPALLELVRGLAPDFLFSCYYRYLLPPDLLAVPRRGALNLHGSLLPRYRGRCPLNWVLIHGEPLTGLSLHYMEATPDSGDLVAQIQVPIAPEDTAWTLSEKMTVAAAQLLRRTYPLLRADAAPRIRQDHSRATYFGGRRPEDGRIQWQQGARQIYNLIRAVTHPFPGAFSTWQGKKIFLWAAKVDTEYAGPPLPPGRVARRDQRLWIGTGDGVLEVLAAQVEGQPEVTGADLAPALAFLEGQTLGQEPELTASGSSR